MGKSIRSHHNDFSDKPHYEQVPFYVPDGWCWCRLDCIGEIITGSTSSKENADYYGGSIPFYKPTDLEQGINTWDASDSLSELENLDFQFQDNCQSDQYLLLVLVQPSEKQD